MTGLMGRMVRRPLVTAARVILRRPRLRALTMSALQRSPKLYTRLRKAMRGPDWKAPRRAHLPRNAEDLSPATLAAYRELQTAIGRRKS